MKKFIIAMDSFKGTLSATEAVDCVATSFAKIYPDAEILKFPIADGGEGTLDAFSMAVPVKIIESPVSGPLGNLGSLINARYGMMGEVAIIELAQASGLTLIDKKDRNPLITTTYGTGELIAQAIQQGARKIMLGLGGSATVDGGLGLARALGIRFLDHQGQELQHAETLQNLQEIDISKMVDSSQVVFEILGDVKNPLLGEDGAACVYGPQKGADTNAVSILEKGLTKLAEVIQQKTGKNFADFPGAGAAGGAAVPLLAFAQTTMRSGIEVLLEMYNVDQHLVGCDLVITGEGCLDRQSAFGKTPIGVAQVAQQQNIPVIAICGSLGEGASSLNEKGIGSFFSCLTNLVPLNELGKHAPKMLTECAEQIARLWKIAQERGSSDKFK